MPAPQPSMAAAMSSGMFREMFSALTRQVWLDTPARARVLGDRLRAGFHFFNNDEDVAAALRALRG